MDDGELVSESDDFQVQRNPRSDHEPKRVDEREDDGRHETSLSENTHNLNRRNTYDVFDSHNHA